jgi:hypothetical protein
MIKVSYKVMVKLENSLLKNLGKIHLALTAKPYIYLSLFSLCLMYILK